jgi:hypothetical protein
VVDVASDFRDELANRPVSASAVAAVAACHQIRLFVRAAKTVGRQVVERELLLLLRWILSIGIA